jgi:hypothetical protein
MRRFRFRVNGLEVEGTEFGEKKFKGKVVVAAGFYNVGDFQNSWNCLSSPERWEEISVKEPEWE